jgi:hypothetical protein
MKQQGPETSFFSILLARVFVWVRFIFLQKEERWENREKEREKRSRDESEKKQTGRK